jgi:hypothetical protein
MASGDATPFPVKNQAYRVTFPIFDADGDLVTAAGALDSEVSKDGGTFADCTNEATEIATSSGMYYLDLTATEMNADTVAVIVKSTGGKTTPLVLYPAPVTRGLVGTSLPAAAADAAGGVPISDAGALDIDTKLANTNEITVARMGALTDWINGGRLDLILDIIAADVVNIDGAAPALASICTEARLAELDAGNLPTDVAACATPAEVNTQVSDVLKTDTIAEQAQGIPPTTPTFEQAVMYLYMALTKSIDVDATLKEFYNNAGTVIWKKALSDNGTNYVEAKGASGP